VCTMQCRVKLHVINSSGSYIKQADKVNDYHCIYGNDF
jgi:hypothetical protein